MVQLGSVQDSGPDKHVLPDTQQESEYQWERSVAGTLARRRESTNKREEQHKPQTKTGYAGSNRIGSITGNIHVTGSMHSLTIDNINDSRTKRSKNHDKTE